MISLVLGSLKHCAGFGLESTSGQFLLSELLVFNEYITYFFLTWNNNLNALVLKVFFICKVYSFTILMKKNRPEMAMTC